MRQPEIIRQLEFSVGLLAHVQTTRDRLRCMAYLIRRSVGRVDPSHRLTLHMRNLLMTFSEGSSELTPYLEIVMGGIYSRNPAVVARPGWHVIDAGANIGIFSIVQAMRGAHVIAIEPHPRTFETLQLNLHQNGLSELVTPVNVALSSTTGTAWLDDSAGSVSAHLADQTEHGHRVQITTLDSVLADKLVPRVDLLKIDVEGAEMEVLRGGHETIKRTRTIVIETHGGLLTPVTACLNAEGFHEVAGGNGPNHYFQRPERA